MNRKNLERRTAQGDFLTMKFERSARQLRRAGETLRGLLERSRRQKRWEYEQAVGYAQDDLDKDELLRTVRLGRASGRRAESSSANINDMLERLGLCREGTLLNAAVVLFGTRLAPEYAQCQLHMARFRGLDKAALLARRQVDGHTFHLLDESMLFLRRHLPVAGRAQLGLFDREDEPLLPVAALREALVNAFCHRDYSRPGGAVRLAIYDDRLEIWSDGALPFGMVPEDLRGEHPSRLRNPLIADVLHRRGLMDRWGCGTQKIVELCVRAGHPEPEFGEQSGAVWVRFLTSDYTAPHRVGHDLSERQRRVLQVLSGAERLAFREIRQRLLVSPDRTLREDLIHLKRLGLIESEGRGRGATWNLLRS